MKISPKWLREFVDLPAADRALADDLTLAGIAVESISERGGATVYEMEITTNRVDAMNHYGVARECSAIDDKELAPLAPKVKESVAADFSIEIANAGLCARYTARAIHKVKIGASPAKIQQRFAELEQKPINNAADATNHTLLEMGHPTHAFDLDKLEGRKMIVRLAKPGETLKTLDGVDRKLHPEDLVIADAVKPVALAGVMGGFDSMITEATKNILIESAWFDPSSIRRTARRHAMHTDASHRFERGADWAACPVACARVAELMVESCGGDVSEEIDTIARPVGHPAITLRAREATRVLGKDISVGEIQRILGRLGFALQATGVGAWKVQIPTWRLDVEREIDLIEEIARIHGFNRFPDTLPAYAGGVVELPQARALAQVCSTLLALGYNEALSLTFVAKEESQQFSANAPVLIANPLSEEAGSMRTSLAPGMLAMLVNNQFRGNKDVRLFETGHVFALQGEASDERLALCMGAYGNADEASIYGGLPRLFFELKGDVETLLGLFDPQSLTFEPDADAPYYHPGRSARALLAGKIIARFGQLHPEAAHARKIKQDVYLVEIALDRLLEMPLHSPRYKKLSRFPAVERDFSFVFGDSVSFEKIREAVQSLKVPELQQVEAVEVFRDGNVPAGKYSTLVRVTFQSLDRTLREEEIAAWTQRIVEALKKVGGVQRA